MKPVSDHEFWARIKVMPNGCWHYTGKPNKGGYCHVRIRGVVTGAHRHAYRLAKGEIPAGMEVMHSCDNPPCINPEHLELGTHAKNIKDAWDRGLIPRTGKAGRPKQTHCKNGHPLKAGNIYWSDLNHRGCRTCRNAYQIKRYHARKSLPSNDLAKPQTAPRQL
jgi:HNH endonuclease